METEDALRCVKAAGHDVSIQKNAIDRGRDGVAHVNLLAAVLQRLHVRLLISSLCLLPSQSRHTHSIPCFIYGEQPLVAHAAKRADAACLRMHVCSNEKRQKGCLRA